MPLLDRYIIARFLTNFLILFALVFVLAAAIDVILQLDEFMEAVRLRIGEDAGLFASLWELARIVGSFYGPRVFQLYTYLLGLVSVGAMGFTLAQMQRHRELVAMLASGMSLYRVAWPIIVAAFGLNLLHLVNSNLIVPEMAPLLIRDHGDLTQPGKRSYEVPLTADASGALLHSPAFYRDGGVLDRPTIMVLDERGRTARRITADRAAWDEERGAWMLENGRALLRTDGDEAAQTEPVESFETSLSPHVLIIRRYREYAQMLRPSQINELLALPGIVDTGTLARIKYGRYSIIFTNILMLIVTLPFFLVREPANLLRRSVSCAAVALGIMLGAFIGMEVEFEALPPAVGVFLPVVILIPLALAAATWVRT